MYIIYNFLYKILDKIWYFNQFEDWEDLRHEMYVFLNENFDKHIHLNWEIVDAVQYDTLHDLKMPIYNSLSDDTIITVDKFIRKHKMHRKKINANLLIKLLKEVKFY